MMREVLRRRFSRLAKEEEAGDNPPRPDLVLVDGGQGQLDAALEIMADLGVDDVAVVGVAKGPDRDAGLERFFLPGKPPFMLEPKSPVLYYLQRLRDEAHRFAIGAHRTRRAGEMRKNPLDEIDGVGPTPSISSSGFFSISAERLARCVPMAKRCASSRRRWR